MKVCGLALGVLMGAAGYYGLSLASAFWVGQQGPSDLVWSTVIGAAVCGGLGIVVARRTGAALAAAGTMLVLVVIGHSAGSDADAWAAPFPADVLTLFFHGARSPVVVGPAVLLAALGLAGEGRSRWRSH